MPLNTGKKELHWGKWDNIMNWQLCTGNWEGEGGVEKDMKKGLEKAAIGGHL